MLIYFYHFIICILYREKFFVYSSMLISTSLTFFGGILFAQICVCRKCQNFSPIPWPLSIFSRPAPLRETERFGDESLTDGICTFCNFDEIGTELYIL